MDAAVGNEPLDRQLGDLAAVGIEAGQDDRARRVVDDEIDAGGVFEGADVAAFAADDAALQVVARQIDDRHRGLDRVLGGAALDRLGDVVLGAVDGGFARFGVEPLEEVRGVVPGVALDLLHQQLFGFVGGQAGDALQAVLLFGDEALVLGGGLGGNLLALRDEAGALGEVLPQALGVDLALGQRGFAAGERLLEGRGLLSFDARLPLGFDEQVVRFFLGVEKRFFRRVSASRSASLTIRSACSSARAMVSAAVSVARRRRLAAHTASPRPPPARQGHQDRSSARKLVHTLVTSLNP